MKSEFVKYLQPDSILLLEGETKKSALEEIITYATTRCTLDDTQLREAIWKREKMMTTGIGNGLALPHIRVAGFPAPLVIIGLSEDSRQHFRNAQRQRDYGGNPGCVSRQGKDFQHSVPLNIIIF